MKFNEVDPAAWPELKPYLDTCLLPLTGLTGSEDPAGATAALERLRDAMDPIEGPFTGRIVTYPALHYGGTGDSGIVEATVRRLKEKAGFRYVILVAAAAGALNCEAPSADLAIGPRENGTLPTPEDVAARVHAMWHGTRE